MLPPSSLLELALGAQQASIAGASEAAEPRGKLCSGCRAVRYCGPACQKADWPAHKAACRELVRRKAGAEGSIA